MIISFEELKSKEHVLYLVFCLNYFDYSQSVGRWVSGKWSVGRWVGSRWVGGSTVGGFSKTQKNKSDKKCSTIMKP